MAMQQAVTVQPDYQTSFTLPRSLPVRVTARLVPEFDEIEDVRLLLQKEMAEKGTSSLAVSSGDGWEAHAIEHYA